MPRMALICSRWSDEEGEGDELGIEEWRRLFREAKAQKKPQRHTKMYGKYNKIVVPV